MDRTIKLIFASDVCRGIYQITMLFSDLAP